MKILKTFIIMVVLTQAVVAQNIKSESTAILLIEFQKTWTEKGIFYQLIKKEYKGRNVLENTQYLLTVAREKNFKVIQAPLILDKNSTYYKKTPFPARFFRRFTAGTWKAEFTDGIYNFTDLVIEGRYGFDATKGSNLLEMLRINNIKTVFVAGFTTDHCVKETINSLNANGFECILISDCTATRNKRKQKKIEDEFTTITSEQLISKIKRRK